MNEIFWLKGITTVLCALVAICFYRIEKLDRDLTKSYYQMADAYKFIYEISKRLNKL